MRRSSASGTSAPIDTPRSRSSARRLSLKGGAWETVRGAAGDLSGAGEIGSQGASAGLDIGWGLSKFSMALDLVRCSLLCEFSWSISACLKDSMLSFAASSQYCR
mmetsp:Transcript_30444/g.63686  ORF Transcript_30444/g.63686 Transcript_30444/m.63686 type:complete len:105 (+) Transcript_30444:134-448(+)